MALFQVLGTGTCYVYDEQKFHEVPGSPTIWIPAWLKPHDWRLLFYYGLKMKKKLKVQPEKKIKTETRQD